MMLWEKNSFSKRYGHKSLWRFLYLDDEESLRKSIEKVMKVLRLALNP